MISVNDSMISAFCEGFFSHAMLNSAEHKIYPAHKC